MTLPCPVQGLTASAGWPTIRRHPLFFVPCIVLRIRRIDSSAIGE